MSRSVRAPSSSFVSEEVSADPGLLVFETGELGGDRWESGREDARVVTEEPTPADDPK